MGALIFIVLAIFFMTVLWKFLRGAGVRRIWSSLAIGAVAALCIALMGAGDDHHH